MFVPNNVRKLTTVVFEVNDSYALVLISIKYLSTEILLLDVRINVSNFSYQMSYSN